MSPKAFRVFCFSLFCSSASLSVVVEYLRTLDGDTVAVNLPILKEQDPNAELAVFWSNISVRLKGIDCPESRGKCERERELALKAKQLVHKRLSEATAVEIRMIEKDKYFRLLAEVWADGHSLADILLKEGLATQYDGGAKKAWCEP